MKKMITVALLAVGLALGMSSVAAQDSGISSDTNQTSDVNVTVSNITKLDVRPTSLDYPGLNPGALDNTSSSGFEQIEITNIGSTDIDEIAAETTMPGDSPFASGDSAQYNSGNFIKIKTETANNGNYNGNIRNVGDYHYVNRVEYTEDPEPTFIQTLEGSEINTELGTSFATPGYDVGRFREGQQEFFYVIYYDEDAGCDGSGNSELWVGTTEHTPNSLGTYDFTDPTASDVTNVSIDNDLGSADYYGAVENLGLGGENYNVFTHCTTSQTLTEHHTVRAKHNVDVETPISGDSASTSATTSGEQDYLLDVSDVSNSLRPGENFPLDIGVEVPLGVAEGEVTEGTLTITASEFTN